jgi:hypothetical protein
VREQDVRKIVWHKRDEMTGEWRRQHKEEFYDVQAYFSQEIIRVQKSRRM